MVGNGFEITIDYRFTIGRTKPTSYRFRILDYVFADLLITLNFVLVCICTVKMSQF